MDYSKLDIPLMLFSGVVVALFLFMVAVNAGWIEVQNQVSANDTLFGGILTAISVYILYSQTKLQERQTEIDERTLEYETQPELQVVSVNYSNDNVEVELVNYGRGVATDLNIITELDCDDVSWYQSAQCRTPLYRLDEPGEPSVDDSIRPSNSPQTYVAESVKIGREPEDGSGVTEDAPEVLLDNLAKHSDEPVSITISIQALAVATDDVLLEQCDKMVTLLSELPDSPRLSDFQNYQSH